ncbi:DUF2799 domain-containing protein [Vibrio maerlii]|uniref:DUF2799 domain-containing protein n=1 Tax=Vibrio maerlii TaxID=2231648 RepID=UPI001F146CE2|nr:DUF2799 domain-containing protein [Vibrio maerlii]
MKILIAVTFIFMLVGCSQPEPLANNSETWRQFGVDQAQKGWLKKSETKMAKYSSSEAVNQELFMAYSEGYEEGRAAYCQQDAYLLGITGRTYLGICDELDWRFRQDYDTGRASKPSGRM